MASSMLQNLTIFYVPVSIIRITLNFPLFACFLFKKSLCSVISNSINLLVAKIKTNILVLLFFASS